MIHQIIVLAKGITKGVVMCSGMTIGGYLGGAAAKALGTSKLGELMLVVGGEIIGTSIAMESLPSVDAVYNSIDKAVASKRDKMCERYQAMKESERKSESENASESKVVNNIAVIRNEKENRIDYVNVNTGNVLYSKSIEEE